MFYLCAYVNRIWIIRCMLHILQVGFFTSMWLGYVLNQFYKQTFYLKSLYECFGMFDMKWNAQIGTIDISCGQVWNQMLRNIFYRLNEFLNDYSFNYFF